MSFRTVYGNNWSENGWRMCNADSTTVVEVAGMRLRVRDGYAATALAAWVRWYHKHVEPIDIFKPTDDWGWSATNDVSTSNHLSGTAVDLNATQYPWGYRTMSADRKALVRKGLRAFEGVIFWGADWDRADEMHYQLNGGTAAGTGASDKLADFCRRRIRDGRLIEKDDDMTPEQARKLADIDRQLKPWPQLGKNAKGEDLTLVDAVAAQRVQLAALRGELADLAKAFAAYIEAHQ